MNLNQYIIGQPVEVLWGGHWWSATITNIRADGYSIHYDGWDHSWDENVPPQRVRQSTTPRINPLGRNPGPINVRAQGIRQNTIPISPTATNPVSRPIQITLCRNKDNFKRRAKFDSSLSWLEFQDFVKQKLHISNNSNSKMFLQTQDGAELLDAEDFQLLQNQDCVTYYCSPPTSSNTRVSSSSKS